MKNLVGVVIALVLASVAWKQWERHALPDGVSRSEMRTLAASVRPEEVVMYTTTECGYCHQAKNWLNSNGFAFTECNMSVEARCQTEFQSYRADGTPFLVINRGKKQHLMREGFDTDEFVAALRG